MNNILGEHIARLRKERGMTQEDLARELNVSYQAVSKWENGVSSPDISNILLLAQFFGVSIDMLFGLELMPEREAADLIEQPAADAPAEEPVPEGFDREDFLPWEDDDTLRAVLFKGRRLVSAEELKKGLFADRITLEYSGDTLNVFSFFDVSCENVGGNIEAGGDVSCAAVAGGVNAGGDVNCENVGGAVSCGGDMECGDVGGDIRAGRDIECGDVKGNVNAMGDVDCNNVGGSVSAGGDVDCDRIGGSVFRG